ncbi:helix-turn-helix domain-containing protein [Sorangium sp. So ce1078]|uniref:helix-turn-helix domain-containing protein n=1 Tax=Sorangium sp. So ce1078 TaxID=3133329 RepID=UPI003F6457A7
MAEVELSVQRYSAEVIAHRHAHHQLVLPVEGALSLSMAGRELKAAGRSGVLVPCEARHAFAASDRNRFLVIDVPLASAEALGAAPWLERIAGGPIALDAAAALLVHAAAAELDEGGSVALRRQWAGLLVLTLAERGERGPERAPEKLRRALRFIEEHAHEPLTVADIAARAELSPGHLHHLFRTVLGTTVQARIADLRLARATELLSRTELGIAEIALRCGYADQSCLTRSLRRRHGVTPAAVRRAARSARAIEPRGGGA